MLACSWGSSYSSTTITQRIVENYFISLASLSSKLRCPLLLSYSTLARQRMWKGLRQRYHHQASMYFIVAVVYIAPNRLPIPVCLHPFLKEVTRTNMHQLCPESAICTSTCSSFGLQCMSETRKDQGNELI
jgi:hypothetical protein